jgi:hypothetical protein
MTAVAPVANATPNASVTPSDGLGPGFREAVTTMIAGVIVLLAGWMLVKTFVAASTASSVDLFNRQKDIMLYGLSLLGTVTGYYFGRVPAELRARQAEATAAASQRSLSDAQDKATTAATTALAATRDSERVKSDVRSTLRAVIDDANRTRMAAGVAPSGAPEPAHLQRLEELLARVG